MALLLILMAQGVSFVDIETRLEGARSGAYRAASASELETARALFVATLHGGQLDELADQWQELGFVLSEERDGDLTLWLLLESQTERRGRGAYAFVRSRPDVVPEADLLWSAPHGLESDDRLTAQLVLELLRLKGSVAAWSTLPREQVDLAHQAATYFQQMHLAFAEARTEGLMVQVHGYNRRKRTTEAGRRATAILSAGLKRAPNWLRRTTACLVRDLDPKVSSYPKTPELGGTTNSQGRALRGHRFLHLELSLGLRRRLVEDVTGRRALVACLGETQ